MTDKPWEDPDNAPTQVFKINRRIFHEVPAPPSREELAAAKLDAFQKALAGVINEYGVDARMSMPDYILAEFLVNSIDAWYRAMLARNRHLSGISIEGK